MLEVKDLYVNYGAVEAIQGISFTVKPGEIVTLIGANGAGKTTTLHTISGLVKAKSGSVTYEGHDLLKTEPSKMITYGMAHVPEGRHVFPEMTVEENLQMGRQLAGTLSGGEQQMLAVGRALMGRPSIILMDEPSMGLSPLLVKEVFAIIKEIHRAGITVLLNEQNARMALSIADRAYVLETGKISISGDAGELLNDERVKKAYLGQ